MTHEDSRLGFCCKFIPADGDAAEAKRMNITMVTMAYLGRLGPGAAYDKVAAVVAHNLEAVRRQIEWVAGRPRPERLLRLASQILPGYTHPVARDFYRDGDLRSLIETSLAEAGQRAREAEIRLSMHPGQFCVLSTLSESALKNAIEEVEYHTEIMAMLGYAGGWHPHGAHINIHGGARAPGVKGFRVGLSKVSAAARDLLTVENDETSYGLDDLLPLTDTLPIVLDLHHHWIASRGEYIEPDDPRIARIVESWREVRPLSHISVSREDLLVDHDPDVRPDFATLMGAGITAKDLRAHSDMMWNGPVNDLVGRHLAWSDFEIEAKFKNLASEGIAAHVAGQAVPARAGLILPPDLRDAAE
ncbi:UV damage endonuclease UvsE [Salinarimonas soli]|uniref:UV damage endonuclease UvsE n=1 Tax=Salinarimonas soli TaxID=1638099 RepID=A0A5B2VD95_9HYPH|nr:UV damage endonuclease UvsE [Salinarimonas soli]KAA2236666.1 UV damage endonuclease UvsE [Salinarimonas soli]